MLLFVNDLDVRSLAGGWTELVGLLSSADHHVDGRVVERSLDDVRISDSTDFALQLEGHGRRRADEA